MELFEKRGSFCLTGSHKAFALEAFAQERAILMPLQECWGGHIIKPPPSHPRRWTWRLYGKAAEELYANVIRQNISVAKRERGDRKLSQRYG